MTGRLNFKHGHAPAGKPTAEYRTWRNMIERCENPQNKTYKYYGGRGIEICRRWRNSFQNFLMDMGPRPTGTSIERINNDKGYSPDNCKWATKREQMSNQRSNIHITHNGETRTLGGWATHLGIKYMTLYNRIYARGMSHEIALSRPVGRWINKQDKETP